MVEPGAFKLSLYWNTLKWQKPEQWLHRCRHTAQNLIYKTFPGAVKSILIQRTPKKVQFDQPDKKIDWFPKRPRGKHGMYRGEDILQGRFTFLNRTKEFGSRVNWRNPEHTYLWDFNLHYFEYLDELLSLDKRCSKDTIKELLGAWIDNNPCPAWPAWHPYPLSLRTTNWVKLLANHPEFAGREELRSLYSQFLFLEWNLEKHLLANHLLENSRALLFGGLFFQGSDAKRWLKTAKSIMQRELREQILEGGGHFERSPMYHCLALEGLLDVYAYLSSTGGDTGWLYGPLEKMCSWLEDIRCPDGRFPLFNDAAMGISSYPEEILDHAGKILGRKPRSQFDRARDCDQLFILEENPVFCAVDGAPIGPDYNPGHAHSDNFTYELYVRGKPLVIDGGTFSYDNDSQRFAFRSTAAHNTVIINGLEQSEVWAGFRVGRRSNPEQAKAEDSGQLLFFQGRYRNQVKPSQGIVHERIIVIKPPEWMLVWDTIQARGDIEACSFCRFAPGWMVHEEKNLCLLRHDSGDQVVLYPLLTDSYFLRDSVYAPEFGRKIPVQQLLFAASGSLYLETGYFFHFQAGADIRPINISRRDRLLEISLTGSTNIVHLDQAGL